MYVCGIFPDTVVSLRLAPCDCRDRFRLCTASKTLPHLGSESLPSARLLPLLPPRLVLRAHRTEAAYLDELLERKYQKSTFNANWISRERLTVLKIWPNVGVPRVEPGDPKFTLLKTLKNSVRN